MIVWKYAKSRLVRYISVPLALLALKPFRGLWKIRWSEIRENRVRAVTASDTLGHELITAPYIR